MGVAMNVDGMGRGQKEERMVDEDMKMAGTEEGTLEGKREDVESQSDKKGKGREREGEDVKDGVEEMRMWMRELEAEGVRKAANRL